MITIVSGTNRKNSHTLMVAKYYQNKLLDRGVETTLFSLEDLPPTIIVSDLYGARSKDFEPIQQMVTKTDKFLFFQAVSEFSLLPVIKSSSYKGRCGYC